MRSRVWFGGASIVVLSVHWVAVVLVLAVSSPVAARDGWSVDLGTSYITGDYGTPVTTRTLYVPLSLTYATDVWSLGATVPYIRRNRTAGASADVSAPVDVSGDEGVIRTLPSLAPRPSSSGIGDVVVRGRYAFILGGTDRFGLAGTTFVKLPTADESQNLGTGKTDLGIGLDVSRGFGEWGASANVGTTFVGRPAGFPFRNVYTYGGGLWTSLTDRTTLTAGLSGSAATLRGGKRPLSANIGLRWRAWEETTLRIGVGTGLNDGAPDFTISTGIRIRWAP